MRRLGPLTLLLIAPLLATAAATAQPFPHTIPLPVDFQPEGIAVGPGSTFYSGSLWDGDIYRGDLRTGDGSIFIDVSGRQAGGMKVDRDRHLLFVAGAFTGHAYVYDTRDGSTVADLTLGKAGASMVNDVAITRHAAYFTESFAPSIYKVPIGDDGAIGTPETITVTGPAASTAPGTFGLNGIAIAAHGSMLLVNHSELGILALVDPETGASTAIDLDKDLVQGTPDGLLLRHRTAWVVQNFANSVVKVHMSADLSSGNVVRTITDPAFKIPTTAAIRAKRLALVNARFDLGFPPPAGPGAPPGTEFSIVLVRR